MRKEYDFSKGKRGPVAKYTGKTRITIYLDDDIIAAFREKGDELGRGYQTLINDALREVLSKNESVVDAKTLRRIIREELKKVGRNGPRKLDSALSEIFHGFQAANSRLACSLYTASGVRRSSAL
jgi:hypothetical protein